MMYMKMQNDIDQHTSSDEYEELLKRYIEVFNRAVKENKDKLPYQNMLSAALKLPESVGDLHYVIYDHRPKGSFSLRLVDGSLEIIDKNKKTSENFCTLSYDYLRNVTENADKYVKNPALLDWSWLKN